MSRVAVAAEEPKPKRATKAKAEPADDPIEVVNLKERIGEAKDNVTRYTERVAEAERAHEETVDQFHQYPVAAHRLYRDNAEQRVKDERAHVDGEKRRLAALEAKLTDSFVEKARELDAVREEAGAGGGFWSVAQPEIERFHQLGREWVRTWKALMGKLNDAQQQRAKAVQLASELGCSPGVDTPTLTSCKLQAGRRFAEGIKAAGMSPADPLVSESLDCRFFSSNR